MATPSGITPAPPCAPPSPPSDPDPVLVLLSLRERQLAAWRALPAEDDAARERWADLSWSASDTMLALVHPLTAEGALAALGHALGRLRRDYPPASAADYPIPLAEHALAVLAGRFGGG